MFQIKKQNTGSELWREKSLRVAKESDSLSKKATFEFKEAKNAALRTGARKELVGLSNCEAYQHLRSIRQASNETRELLIDVNSAIKLLNGSFEILNKNIFLIEEDLKKNKNTFEIRNQRTTREKALDNADLMLKNEQKQLFGLKNLIEKKKIIVLENLKILSNQKKILSQNLEHFKPLLFLFPDYTLPNKKIKNSFSMQDEGKMKELFGKTKEIITKSEQIKTEVELFLIEIEKEKKIIKVQVDDILKSKIKETLKIKDQLKEAIERNREATSKTIRNFKMAQHSWLDINGPENKKFLEISEKSDRPIIKSLKNQNRNTENIKIKMGSEGLLQNMRSTVGTIGKLKDLEIKLLEDINNKNNSLYLDRQASIMRKRKE